MKRNKVIEEIYQNRNHSWAREIMNRAQNKLDKTALKYRGKKISYQEYIDKFSKEWAPALKVTGLNKNDRIALCVSSIPEYAYLFGAISFTGGQFNPLSSGFDNDYLFDLICKSTYDYVFISEDNVNNMFDTLKRVENETDKKIVIIPLNNSLPDGNPFEDITSQFENYDKELLQKNLSNLSNVIDVNDFLEKGKNYSGKVEEYSSLDDIFTISYSSGTTDGNKPKGIKHRNKHYTIMGRYHDTDVSGLPNLNDSVTYSIIPTQSNSYIASILSDTLMEGACVALDPITQNDYFLYALYINQPSMAICSTSTWIKASKIYYSLKKEIRELFKFKNLLLPVAVGEGMSSGEEKYLNKFTKDTKCGINVTKLPFSITKMSSCGGCCELGSLFTRVLRAYYNIKKDKNIMGPIGYNTYDFVNIQALREDGTFCEPYEVGRLVAQSECTMVEYDDAPERTSKFFVKDSVNGETWGDLGCNGFKDKHGFTYIKGRMMSDQSITPEYEISDVVSLDTKNVLSNSVVYFDDYDKYIIYLEKQPSSKISNEKMMSIVYNRCLNKFGEDVANKLEFYILDKDEEFKLTCCLKRDIGELHNEEYLKHTTKPVVQKPEIGKKLMRKK